jgi:beta-galactosidase
VSILDAQGRVVPTAGNEITFEVQGEARCIGLDNGDMRSHEDDRGKTRKAFNGLCLAMLQSTATAGQVKVTATSPGLEPATVTINTGA